MKLEYKNTPIITSMIFPLILFINRAHILKTNIFLYFTLITVNGSIISIMFWEDPILNRKQLIHKIDAINARFVLVNYAFYKIIINQNNLLFFLMNYFIMLFFFYLSNYYSSKNWCSKLHIHTHITAHVFAIICFLITVSDLRSSIKL